MKQLIVISLVLVVLAVPASLDAQQTAIQQTQGFFDFICTDGGQWRSENPSYKKEQPEGIMTFFLHFDRRDEHSIWGTISALTGEGDTLLLWEFWEFIDLQTGNSHQVQRSKAGAYAFGEATVSVSADRVGEQEFTFPDGSTLRHRSTHRRMDEHTMEATAENFDKHTNEWVAQPPSTWTRISERKERTK